MTHQYYGLLDIFSELGGIGALCLLLLSLLALFSTFSFTLSLVNMIRRKDQLKWKQCQIKKMIRWKETLHQDMVDKYAKLEKSGDKDQKKELEVDMRMLKMATKMPEESARDMRT